MIKKWNMAIIDQIIAYVFYLLCRPTKKSEKTVIYKLMGNSSDLVNFIN